MPDFNQPELGSTYVTALTEIRESDNAVARMFNGVSAQNIPVGAVQFAGGVFGLWNGSSFPVQAVAIGGGGTGATTAVGARGNLGLSSTAEANALYMKILSNGSDINDPSIFRTNIDVPSNAETLLVANDLSDLNDEVAAFNNIKQGATTIFSGTVIEATPAQMRAGTGNRFPDAATIVADRVPVSIWTGSDAFVSAADILADIGFVVVPGRYWVKASANEYTVDIRDITQVANGSSQSLITSTNVSVISAKWDAVAGFKITTTTNGQVSPSFTNITEVFFTPL